MQNYYKAGAHDPGHWPLAAGTPGADLHVSQEFKAPSPSTALHGASSQAASEGHLSTCPCLVKTIKTAGLFGYWAGWHRHRLEQLGTEHSQITKKADACLEVGGLLDT